MLLSEANLKLSMIVDKFGIPNSCTQERLGITFDNRLNFNPYVANLTNKASQKLQAPPRVGNRERLSGSFFYLISNWFLSTSMDVPWPSTQ